jgi:hypothetical protein
MVWLPAHAKVYVYAPAWLSGVGQGGLAIGVWTFFSPFPLKDYQTAKTHRSNAALDEARDALRV